MAVAGKTKKVFDNRYEILAIVGRGTGSVVYHARHVYNPSVEVALKVLVDQKNIVQNSERLRKEALAMISCRHKNVLRLDDFHSVGTLCYLCLEYAPESDLRRYVTKLGGKLPVAQGERYLLQATDALSFVHKSGIIHRDMKPDNMLVINPREVRLGDFGIALLPGEQASLQDLQVGVGTMNYMAPEILEGTSYDHRADIYAVGISIYEMIAGMHPFENAPLMKQLDVRMDRNVPTLRSLAPEVPEYLSRIVMRSIRFRPEDRFQSAKEMVQCLEEKRAPEDAPLRVVTPLPVEPAPQEETPLAPAESPVAEEQGSNAETQEAEQLFAALSAEPHEQHTFEESYDGDNESIDDELSSSEEETTPVHDRLVEEPETTLPFESSEALDPEISATPGVMVTESSDEMEQNIAESTPFNFDSHATVILGEDSLKATREDLGATPVPASTTDFIIPDTHTGDNGTASGVNLVEESAQPPATSGAYSNRDATVGISGREMKKNRDLVKSPTLGAKDRLKAFALPLFVLAAAGVIFFIKDYGQSSAPREEIAVGTPDSVQTTQHLPTFDSSRQLEFPALPGGSYSGTISHLIGESTIPLSFISFPEKNQLVILIGLDGWTPKIVSLDKVKISPTDPKVKIIRVASNGVILDLSASGLEADAPKNSSVISGTFRNVVTDETGSWKVTPVK